MVGSIVDTALLEGIKKSTGLEASIYTQNRLSAAAITSTDGLTRPLGITENRSIIRSTVLGNGKIYTGPAKLLNRSYYAAYIPILNLENMPIGMISVATLQNQVLGTAAASIQLTFIMSAVLIIVSILPIYFLTRFLVKQIK